jgi:hypothetical protein
MPIVSSLIGFGLRQIIGEGALPVVSAIEQRFRDHSQTLPKALARAHDRAWQALGVALAGDSFLDRVKLFFASGDDKGIREQVQLFLKDNGLSFEGTPPEFAQACLEELKDLRKSGLLVSEGCPVEEIARQAANWQRYTEPQRLIEGARQAVGQLADAILERYPNLARLIREQTGGGPPLLVAAFAYFFRREVETDTALAHSLFWDGLRKLSATQEQGFTEVGKALTTLGDSFDHWPSRK